MKWITNAAPASLARAAPSLTAAVWLLRIAVLGFCAGVAATIFLKLGTGIGTYFFLEWGIGHPQVAKAERIGAYTLITFSVLAFVRPHWAFLLPISLVTFLEAWARYFNGGVPFFEWTIWAYFLRIAAPAALALLVLDLSARRLGAARHMRAAAWILRIAIVVVFTVHGLEAFYQHPRFIDYIIGTGYNLGGFWITEDTARTLLMVIGTVDIAVAVTLLIRPFPIVLYWMAFWGLITALARVTTFGPGVYYEVLMRFSHFLAPIALLLLIRAAAAMETPPAESPAQPA